MTALTLWGGILLYRAARDASLSRPRAGHVIGRFEGKRPGCDVALVRRVGTLLHIHGIPVVSCATPDKRDPSLVLPTLTCGVPLRKPTLATDSVRCLSLYVLLILVCASVNSTEANKTARHARSLTRGLFILLQVIGSHEASIAASDGLGNVCPRAWRNKSRAPSLDRYERALSGTQWMRLVGRLAVMSGNYSTSR